MMWTNCTHQLIVEANYSQNPHKTHSYLTIRKEDIPSGITEHDVLQTLSQVNLMSLTIRLHNLLCTLTHQEWHTLGYTTYSHKAEWQTRYWLLWSNLQNFNGIFLDTCDNIWVPHNSQDRGPVNLICSKRQNYSLIYLSIRSVNQNTRHWASALGKTVLGTTRPRSESLVRETYKAHNGQTAQKCSDTGRLEVVWSSELRNLCPRPSQHTQDPELCPGLHPPLAPPCPSVLDHWHPFTRICHKL